MQLDAVIALQEMRPVSIRQSSQQTICRRGGFRFFHGASPAPVKILGWRPGRAGSAIWCRIRITHYTRDDFDHMCGGVQP